MDTICTQHLTRKAQNLYGLGFLNGGGGGIVLDLLHARKVSQLNLQFKFAQFPRYPNFASLNTYANPLELHKL